MTCITALFISSFTVLLIFLLYYVNTFAHILIFLFMWLILLRSEILMVLPQVRTFGILQLLMSHKSHVIFTALSLSSFTTPILIFSFLRHNISLHTKFSLQPFLYNLLTFTITLQLFLLYHYIDWPAIFTLYLLLNSIIYMRVSVFPQQSIWGFTSITHNYCALTIITYAIYLYCRLQLGTVLIRPAVYLYCRLLGTVFLLNSKLVW